MKHLCVIILTILFVPLLLQAQHNCHPQRTAEDIARKQTELLVRELGIHDSIVKDTLFRMHLKFARKRVISNTRAEAMQYMQEMNAELQKILTPMQYQQFMNQQVNYEPHRHHQPYNRIITRSGDSIPLNAYGEAPNIQQAPSGSQS